jgi:hypothetical protein
MSGLIISLLLQQQTQFMSELITSLLLQQQTHFMSADQPQGRCLPGLGVCWAGVRAVCVLCCAASLTPF